MTIVALQAPGPPGRLGATLELPDGPGPFPGVVLVSGSGPLDRDSDHEKIRFGVSRELAHALRGAGVASLRFDKRGVGSTDLDWRTAGLEDDADDVAAAVETLRLLRIDLAAKVSRNHDKIERTTTDVAGVGGARLNATWFREFLAHDVAADLRRIEVPVLAVTGSKDLQTPPEDVHRIAEIVGPSAETHLLPDVTHTLRRQEGTPSLRHYKQEVRRPLDPAVVDLVVAWAGRVTRVPTT
jgi:pimeloyl-ACP methyl ester carboxylesterase